MPHKRNVSLDLVRCFAILPVLMVHFASQASPSAPPILYVLGNYGVEIFFALSGFLIGGIILREFDTEHFLHQARVFYARRWLRTVPLYYFFFIVTIFVTHEGFKVSTDFSAANFLFLPFLQNLAWPMVAPWYHESWSLAVEEWFYLLFPLLFFVFPGSVTRRVLKVALTLAVVPLVLRIMWFDPSANWDENVRKVVVIRLDAIAYGILAVWLSKQFSIWCKAYRGFILSAGFVGICFCTSIYLGAVPASTWVVHTVLFTAVSASFALVVLGAGQYNFSPSAGPAFLINWLSTRSYALYLCHGSIIKLMIFWGIFGNPLPYSIIIFSIACFALAEASHQLIELPFMRMRPPPLPKAAMA